MNDRELLELAAKAAGEPYFEHAPEGGLYLSNGEDWNPLTDDGDALRLATKLSLTVGVGLSGSTVSDSSRNPIAVNMHNHDPYAATRRAIVRAAAELGRNMK